MSTTDQRVADSSLTIDLDLWVDLVDHGSWQALSLLREAVAAFERPTDVTLTLHAFESSPQRPGVARTLDAQRLCALALTLGGPALQSAAAERFWAAHLSEGLNIDDHIVLQRTAAECGLDEGRVATVLAGDGFVAEVRADEQLAVSFGFDAAPALVVNGVASPSVGPEVADFLAVLRQAVNIT